MEMLVAVALLITINHYDDFNICGYNDNKPPIWKWSIYGYFGGWFIIVIPTFFLHDSIATLKLPDLHLHPDRM